MLPSATAQTVTPLRLAAPDDGATSYDWEHIAYLLPGALPTLIDPGPEHLADALLNALADSGIAPFDFTRSHATIWTALSVDPALQGVQQTDRQVYATAMYEGLTIVEAVRPETPALTALGASIHVL